MGTSSGDKQIVTMGKRRRLESQPWYKGKISIRARTSELVFNIAEYCVGRDVILGVSGGKDSTVALALCVEALGADRVHALLLPNGEQKDIATSKEICDLYGVKYDVVNIAPMVESFVTTLERTGFTVTDAVKFNIPPRVRMTTLYGVAQSLGNTLVVNTSNYSEAFVGYTTKWGDNVGDFGVLNNLYVSEVIEVGKELGVPEKYLIIPPADGLTGKTDEEVLGFEYKAIELLGQGLNSAEVEHTILERHRNTQHKRSGVVPL